MELLQQKLGPQQLRQSIEHHYSHKNFQEALRLSLEFIEFVESRNQNKIKNQNQHQNDDNSNNNYNRNVSKNNPNRLTSTRDMLEIATRSALKLGDVNLAVKCVDKLVSNEPGHIYFKGLVYARGDQYAGNNSD